MSSAFHIDSISICHTLRDIVVISGCYMWIGMCIIFSVALFVILLWRTWSWHRFSVPVSGALGELTVGQLELDEVCRDSKGHGMSRFRCVSNHSAGRWLDQWLPCNPDWSICTWLSPGQGIGAHSLGWVEMGQQLHFPVPQTVAAIP